MKRTRRLTTSGHLAVLALALAGTAAAAPETVRIVPRVHPESSYTFEGTVETFTKDITFDMPPEYEDSFSFWTTRMKGIKKSERIEFLTLTREAREDGTVPFRRIAPRYMVSFMHDGRPSYPYGSVEQDVSSQVWEGTLDPQGHVRTMKRVKGADNPDLAYLGYPLLDHLFPRPDGPREVAPDKPFTDVTSMPMPAQLTIRGLDAVRLQVTRDYVLKNNGNGQVEFTVKVAYALDPATPPTEPETTCVISGGGTGTATFDVRRGVFVKARMPTRLIIDIEAPLRKLPNMAEDEDPGLGKIHLEMFVTIAGKQKVDRIFGEDAPPPE
jgi:hypothetical protein